jgi:hypothetical protein
MYLYILVLLVFVLVFVSVICIMYVSVWKQALLREKSKTHLILRSGWEIGIKRQ